MPNPIRRHPSLIRHRRLRAPRLRAVAALLCLALAFSVVAPAWAVAGELDTEGEGAAPPGPIPGLEEAPEFEPGGEEPALEEQPPLPGEEDEEPAEEVPPGEVEEGPVPEEVPPPEAAPPAPEVVAPAPEEPAPQPEPPAAPEAPPASAPAYEPEPAPDYETAPPPVAPVQGEAIIAPPVSHEGHPRQHGEENAPSPVVEAPPPIPAEAPPSPEPGQAPPPAMPAEHEATAPGSLTGHDFHTVAPGECLWSIAEARLRPGASNARIAAEVHRLWRLNADRIGTGDPDLILAGIELRLR